MAIRAGGGGGTLSGGKNMSDPQDLLCILNTVKLVLTY